jgi:hypothetical protein
MPNIRVVFGGIVVIVLAIGPKVFGFKPGRGRWILRAINPYHDFFVREVKPSVPCRNVLRHVRIPAKNARDT